MPTLSLSVDDLMARFSVAEKNKQLWESHLQDCYHHFLPQRETFYSYTPGQKKNVDVYDDTGPLAIQRFASRLQATICPPWRRWSRFASGSEVPEEQKDDIQDKLDDLTEVVFTHIHRSNFDTQVFEMFLDLGISTGAIICNEGEGEDLLRFTAVPLSELYIEEGPNGVTETIWRKRKVPVSHLERMYRGYQYSSSAAKAKKNDPKAEICVIEGYVYNPEDKLYWHVAIEEDTKHLGYKDHDEVSAWAVPRWLTVPGEVYGRGPAMTVLPTVKVMNKVREFILRNAALAIAGPYTALDDGVLNPYTLQIAPNLVIPVMSNDSSNPSIRPLERSGDFNVSELVLADMQESVKKAMFNSMRTAAGPVKTATEIALDNKELVEEIGSSFGRLQTEFIERILNRVIYILAKNGVIPKIKVDGKFISLKHTSPLAVAQDMEDLLTLEQGLAYSQAVGPQAMQLGIKIEDIPGWVFKKLGIDQDLIRSEGERAGLMNNMAELMQQGAGMSPEAA